MTLTATDLEAIRQVVREEITRRFPAEPASPESKPLLPATVAEQLRSDIQSGRLRYDPDSRTLLPTI